MAREIPASLFDKAAAVFGGWTDPESGLRVLRIQTRGPDEKAPVWSTPYHQLPCFLEGGRKVVLNGASPRGGRAGVLDLTTGVGGACPKHTDWAGNMGFHHSLAQTLVVALGAAFFTTVDPGHWQSPLSQAPRRAVVIKRSCSPVRVFGQDGRGQDEQ